MDYIVLIVYGFVFGLFAAVPIGPVNFFASVGRWNSDRFMASLQDSAPLVAIRCSPLRSDLV